MLARTLSLTTPPLVGADILELEGQLQKAGWLQAAPDGVYDLVAAQAVYRAKFWLGYATPDQRAGGSFQKHLTGEATQTPEMLARRRERIRAAKSVPATRATLIVSKAVAELGQEESPAGSNRVKYASWYGLNGQPWCAMFVTWVYVTAGFPGRTFVRGSRYAYVPFVVGDARAGRNGLMVATSPLDAHLACYDWDRNGVADHIGICVTEATLNRVQPGALSAAKQRFGPLAADEFWAVEGNTAVGNDSNGGQVMLRKRRRSQVQTFAKVAAT